MSAAHPDVQHTHGGSTVAIALVVLAAGALAAVIAPGLTAALAAVVAVGAAAAAVHAHLRRRTRTGATWAGLAVGAASTLAVAAAASLLPEHPTTITEALDLLRATV